MLTIRQQQIDTMMQPQLEKHTLTMGKTIQQHYPVFFQYYTTVQMQYWVAKQVDYLYTLNIVEKNNITTIVDIIAQHGEQFERCSDPTWGLEILENVERSESLRCVTLVDAHEEYLNNTIESASDFSNCNS